MKKLLFIVDPLAELKAYKDSSVAMMRGAQARGHTVATCQVEEINWQSGQGVQAQVQHLQLHADHTQWHTVTRTAVQHLHEFDAVVMRKDPPFDSEYFYATHLLEQAEREGARVFNDPKALRDHPEKLAILEFEAFTTPTLVTRSSQHIKAFHQQHQDIILKPLDGMGGKGIFRITADGLNLGSVIETLSQNGQQTIMAQKFVPAIAQGDKRILLIDGEPVPYCLARIPQGGEVRGNLAAGGKGVAQALSERDKEIAAAIGPVLAQRGLFLIGLDVIGDSITEINVTSPTCFVEIAEQTGWDVAQAFIQALEKRLAA